jgi:hypothetical protein
MLKKGIFTNWKTTVFGLGAVLSNFALDPELAQYVTGILATVFVAVSGDADKQPDK